MKVCTDACVFGAWAGVGGAERILDIGTGTGLLSLMAAQRNPEALIDAVEVEEGAVRQAGMNFEASPFSARLKVHAGPVQDFRPGYGYDCVICNPPFYQNDLKSPDPKTSMAHHAGALDFQALFQAAGRLVSPGGRFHVMLPVAESYHYAAQHAEGGWRLTGELLLSHRPGMAPFRRMMTFRSEDGKGPGPVPEQLFIYEETGGNYDSAFKEYLKPFYLGF